MLTLSLFDVEKINLLQQWQFQEQSSIKVGRSGDNDVVIISDLISRHHLELQLTEEKGWRLINQGKNGTFFQGKQVDELIISSGVEVQLAQDGLWLKFDLAMPKSSPIPDVRNNLETILEGINAQFPLKFLQERYQETQTHLRKIQELQEKSSNLSEEINTYLEENKRVLQELITGIEKSQQLLEDLQKHLEYDKKAAENISNKSTRIEQLMENINQDLEELDKELGRIHSQYLINNIKRSFNI